MKQSAKTNDPAHCTGSTTVDKQLATLAIKDLDNIFLIVNRTAAKAVSPEF